jgi:hypothetical protein
LQDRRMLANALSIEHAVRAPCRWAVVRAPLSNECRKLQTFGGALLPIPPTFIGFHYRRTIFDVVTI